MTPASTVGEARQSRALEEGTKKARVVRDLGRGQRRPHSRRGGDTDPEELGRVGVLWILPLPSLLLRISSQVQACQVLSL